MNTTISSPSEELKPEIKQELTQPERPFDALLNKTTADEVVGFLEGCQLLARTIDEESPDIVFVPLRGAKPIITTALAFSRHNLEAKQPLVVELPIGERQTIVEKDKHSRNSDKYRVVNSGMNNSTKSQIIDTIVDELSSSGVYIPGDTKLMLVDEAQTGSTITTAAKELQKSLLTHGEKGVLHVVAMQDSSTTEADATGKRAKDMLPKYRNLVGTNKVDGLRPDTSDMVTDTAPNLKCEVIDLPLFTVDANAFLDKVLWFDSPEGSPYSYENIENTAATRLLNVLVDIYNDPETALSELESIRRGELAIELGQTILQGEILENLTDPVKVKGVKPHTVESTVGWWLGFVKKVIANKTLKAGSTQSL